MTLRIVGTVCFGLIFTFLVCGSVFAARNEEVVRYPGLFLFGDFGQSLSLTYGYTDHKSSTGSESTSSHFAQRYTLSNIAAIRDPHLVFITFDGTLSYEQIYGTNTSKILDGEYNISVSVLDLSDYPSLFTSSRTQALISNGFTPTYTLTRNTNQVTGSLLNKYVPLYAQYVHSSMSTSGLALDSTVTSDSMSLIASHYYQDVSATRLFITHDSSQSAGSDSVSYGLTLDNNLTLDRRKNYKLTTGLQINQSKSSDIPQENLSLSEQLSCQFGKALRGTLGVGFSTASTVDFQNQTQKVVTQTANVALSHHLYQSLSTILSGSASRSTLLGGSQTNYGGTAVMTYVKLLPAQSVLTLSNSLGRQIVEQKLTGSTLAGRDELHPAVVQGGSVTPNIAGQLTAVLSVRSINPDILYVKDIDYRVNLVLGVIEIISGGGIANGTDLYISYTVSVNQTISFVTDSLQTAGALSFFNSRYRIGAEFTTQSQKALSGAQSNQALVDSKLFSVHADARYDETSYGLGYENTDSTTQQLSRYSAYLDYHTTFNGNDSFTVSLRDSYNINPAREASVAVNTNTASLGTSYGRTLFRWANTALSATLVDTRSDSTGASSDYALFRVSIMGMIYKLSLSLVAQTYYRFAGGVTNQDTSLNASIGRSF